MTQNNLEIVVLTEVSVRVLEFYKNIHHLVIVLLLLNLLVVD